MNNTVEITDLSDWEVETLRLTAFVNEEIRPENITWWNSLFGEEADSTESRPKQGIRSDEGIFEGGNLKFTSQPSRIDWLYSWKPEEDSEGLPIIGQFDDYYQKFSLKMIEWLAMSPPIVRLAFGTVLLKPVENREEGYKELSNFLPDIKIDAEGSRDFLYQINRPRISKIVAENNIKVNRLSKWSVIRLHRLHITISGDKSRNIAIPDSGDSACRLELDISTDENISDNLPYEKLADAFSELVDLGIEIVVNGDIK